MADCIECNVELDKDNSCPKCHNDWRECPACEQISVRTVMVSHGSSYDESEGCQNTDCDYS